MDKLLKCVSNVLLAQLWIEVFLKESWNVHNDTDKIFGFPINIALTCHISCYIF